MIRKAKIFRKTKETEISADIKIEGTGKYNINTGIGFFNHMLEQLSYHSLIDINIEANGDLHIDYHHTVEDCGIVLGKALSNAIGNRCGIIRYSSLGLVMDEVYTNAAIDISGRPLLVWHVNFPVEKIGNFNLDLIKEFFKSFVIHAKITLHILNEYGNNSHHISETCFKVLGRILRESLSIDLKQKNTIPSTKGII